MFHRVVTGPMVMRTRSLIGRVGSRNLGLDTQSISVLAYCDILCREFGDGVVVIGTYGDVRNVVVSILARLSRWYVIGRTTACASGIMVYVNEVMRTSDIPNRQYSQCRAKQAEEHLSKTHGFNLCQTICNTYGSVLIFYISKAQWVSVFYHRGCMHVCTQNSGSPVQKAERKK